MPVPWPIEAAANLVVENIVATLREHRGRPVPGWRTMATAIRAHESLAREEFYRAGGAAWSPSAWKQVRTEADAGLSLTPRPRETR